MVDFKAITAVNINFAVHPITKEAHKHFNSNYGGLLPDFDVIFTDAGKTLLKDDCIDILCAQILQELVLPTATGHTPDTTIILPLFNTSGFRVSWNSKPMARLTKDSLKTTMTGAMANKHNRHYYLCQSFVLSTKPFLP